MADDYDNEEEAIEELLEDESGYDFTLDKFSADIQTEDAPSYLHYPETLIHPDWGSAKRLLKGCYITTARQFSDALPAETWHGSTKVYFYKLMEKYSERTEGKYTRAMEFLAAVSFEQKKIDEQSRLIKSKPGDTDRQKSLPFARLSIRTDEINSTYAPLANWTMKQLAGKIAKKIENYLSETRESIVSIQLNQERFTKTFEKAFELSSHGITPQGVRDLFTLDQVLNFLPLVVIWPESNPDVLARAHIDRAKILSVVFNETVENITQLKNSHVVFAQLLTERQYLINAALRLGNPALKNMQICIDNKTIKVPRISAKITNTKKESNSKIEGLLDFIEHHCQLSMPARFDRVNRQAAEIAKQRFTLLNLSLEENDEKQASPNEMELMNLIWACLEKADEWVRYYLALTFWGEKTDFPLFERVAREFSHCVNGHAPDAPCHLTWDSFAAWIEDEFRDDFPDTDEKIYALVLEKYLEPGFKDFKARLVGSGNVSSDNIVQLKRIFNTKL